MTLSVLPCVNALWAEVKVTANLDPGEHRLRLPIVKLRASQFTPPASHALRRISNHNAFSLIDDDQGRLFPPCNPQAGNPSNGDSAYQKKFTPGK
jgi:hypothetical protein